MRINQRRHDLSRANQSRIKRKIRVWMDSIAEVFHIARLLWLRNVIRVDVISVMADINQAVVCVLHWLMAVVNSRVHIDQRWLCLQMYRA